MSAHDRILAVAAENTRLLNAVAQVDYAPSALKQYASYLADLRHEIDKMDQTVRILQQELNMQRKEHERYRDSTLRRFAYRVGGKIGQFELKAEKEERQYIDALNTELKVKARRELLETQLSEAEHAQREIEAGVKERVRLQKELNNLYTSVFSGPTPDFPEEDAKESEVHQATVVYDQRQEFVKREAQALKILRQADKIMLGALNQMATALQYSQYDIYGFGGSLADFAERSAISNAQVGINQVQMLISQAQRIQPAVKSIGDPSIANGNLIGDFLFDNIFSDIDFQRKIQQSGKEMVECAHRLKTEIAQSEKREKTVQDELKEVTADLETARIALQQIRREAFEAIVRGERASIPSFTPGVARSNTLPPSYDDSADPPSYTG